MSADAAAAKPISSIARAMLSQRVLWQAEHKRSANQELRPGALEPKWLRIRCFVDFSLIFRFFGDRPPFDFFVDFSIFSLKRKNRHSILEPLPFLRGSANPGQSDPGQQEMKKTAAQEKKLQRRASQTRVSQYAGPLAVRGCCSQRRPEGSGLPFSALILGRLALGPGAAED